MTERKIAAESICCAVGCGKLGEYHLGARVWASSDPDKKRGALDVETSMVVCAEHCANPPTTAPAFFEPDTRERISIAIKAAGRAPPNFAGAEWAFTPVAPPAQKAAH